MPKRESYAELKMRREESEWNRVSTKLAFSRRPRNTFPPFTLSQSAAKQEWFNLICRPFPPSFLHCMRARSEEKSFLFFFFLAVRTVGILGLVTVCSEGVCIVQLVGKRKSLYRIEAAGRESETCTFCMPQSITGHKSSKALSRLLLHSVTTPITA